MRKLFIVGCPRSGTTVLQQALNRHPDVVVPAETAYFHDFVGHLRRGQQRALQHIERDLDIQLTTVRNRVREPTDIIARYEEIAERYLARLGRAEAAYFGDKSPHHLFVLDRVLRYFPDSRVIVVFRDGRDVALSLSKVPWAPPGLFLNFSYWLRACRQHVRIRADRPGQVLEVRYEDFVSDPARICEDVCGFLELPYDDRMVRGDGTAVGIPEWEWGWKGRAAGPIDRNRVGAWRRELTPTRVELLERWGGRVLSEFGYDVTVSGDSTPLRLRFINPLSLAIWRLRRGLRLVGREFLPLRKRGRRARE
jgi:hypothetical protein